LPTMPGMTMSGPPSAAISLFYHALFVVGVFLALVGTAAYFLFFRSPIPQRRSSRPAEILALGLGLLWFVDACLQAQPLMVTRFVGGVLAPLLQGEPAPLAFLVALGMRLWGTSPIWLNVAATYLQAGIGLVLLFGRREGLEKIALVASLLWSIVVWIFGEAMGGIFAGGSALTGSPGSVFLYGIAALLLLRGADWWEGEGPRAFFPRLFAFVFLLDALLGALPAAGWWGSTMASYYAQMASMPQPATLASVFGALAAFARHHAFFLNLFVVLGCAALGTAFLVWPSSSATAKVALLFTLLLWIFGQDFGVMGGMATDPNTGAILLLEEFVWLRLQTTGAPGGERALAERRGEA